MCRSANTVRIYDATATTAWKWRNHASNQADGSGSFGRLAQRKVVVSAMQASASATELREETVQYRIIAAPGYPEMMDEMVTLNSDRNETAFIIVDAPFRLNPTEAITWIQGTAAIENGEAGLTTKNTYAAAYYPSVITTNPSTGDSVVAPASHSVLYTYAYSDNVSYQWFAPAGLTRGVVQNAANVGYLNSESEFVAVALTQGSRDAMYENKLNPIARFPAEGVVVWGQKSLHASASALDRVNVARLTAYLRERFAVIARPFLFEPNDAGTRANAKQVFDGFLANILQQRGIYDFAVVCDTTNNTPARIDANEFYIDVAVEPTKAAEFIYIPIRILNTGEIAG
jgi:phage tail sheath protein FI